MPFRSLLSFLPLLSLLFVSTFCSPTECQTDDDPRCHGCHTGPQQFSSPDDIPCPLVTRKATIDDVVNLVRCMMLMDGSGASRPIFAKHARFGLMLRDNVLPYYLLDKRDEITASRWKNASKREIFWDWVNGTFVKHRRSSPDSAKSRPKDREEFEQAARCFVEKVPISSDPSLGLLWDEKNTTNSSQRCFYVRFGGFPEHNRLVAVDVGSTRDCQKHSVGARFLGPDPKYTSLDFAFSYAPFISTYRFPVSSISLGRLIETEILDRCTRLEWQNLNGWDFVTVFADMPKGYRVKGEIWTFEAIREELEKYPDSNTKFAKTVSSFFPGGAALSSEELIDSLFSDEW